MLDWICLKKTSCFLKVFALNYEYKLEPTRQQAETFDTWLEICPKAYNHALRERKDWVNSHKCRINACPLEGEYIIPADAPRPTYASQCKPLAAAKKDAAISFYSRWFCGAECTAPCRMESNFRRVGGKA